jgi:hypothetical protein
MEQDATLTPHIPILSTMVVAYTNIVSRVQSYYDLKGNKIDNPLQ